MNTQKPILNIAAYKFITISDHANYREPMREICEQLQLRGTILLTPEGINLFIAGAIKDVQEFLTWLRKDPLFNDLEVKESHSDKQPFRRMLVKLKREIITMKNPLIRPEENRAPAVDAQTLKRWLDQGQDDEGYPISMVDTRNGFEVDVGTFEHALDYRLHKFSEFPAVISEQKENLQGKTLVTFCTGGIRCEKAAIYMQNEGFERVYQLDGGILKYFETVGGAHYHGDCFVFDDRTALNPELTQSTAVQCYACRAVVSEAEQKLPSYVKGKSCPHCAQKSSRAQLKQSEAHPVNS